MLLFCTLLITLPFSSFSFSANTYKSEKIAVAPATLREYLLEKNVDEELASVVLAAGEACCEISNELRTLPLKQNDQTGAPNINIQGEEQTTIDIVANDIFLARMKAIVAACASEEEDSVVPGDSTKRYKIAFDPLDGSSNLDVSMPTGTIFGIAPHVPSRPFSASGRSLVAAGYAIYSSCTELVISIENETVGFTLTNDGTFELSRAPILCPPRGPYYSLNEAREPDWPSGLRRWIHDAKRGNTPSKQKYSSRYVCSLCADVHRTLLQGGWAGNPRPHLRLLYEAAPLAFVLQAAGGLGSDGTRNLLDIAPSNGIHDRVCVFLGSKLDVEDLISYGDVQQAPQKYGS